MSVNNANLTGLQRQVNAPRHATPVAQQNQGPRANALANANAPVAPVAPVAATTGAPVAAVAPAVGGTTAPGAAKGVAPTIGVANQANTVVQSMAMATFAPFLAVATAAVSSRAKINRVAGDSKQDTGDVEVETQTEVQPDALQEADQEQGSGEINEANQMGGPAT